MQLHTINIAFAYHVKTEQNNAVYDCVEKQQKHGSENHVVIGKKRGTFDYVLHMWF
jgi:hypothetical protein